METECPHAGLHKVIEALVVGAGRCYRLGVERCLVVYEPEVARREAYIELRAPQPARRQVVTHVQLLQPHIGGLVDIFQPYRALPPPHPVVVLGAPLYAAPRNTAVLASPGRRLRHAVAIEEGLRLRHADAA